MRVTSSEDMTSPCTGRLARLAAPPPPPPHAIMLQPLPAEQTALQRFFRAAQFAVVGASTDRTKYGNRVLRWYQNHQLPVTPVHPKATSVEGLTAVSDLGSVMEQAANPVEAKTSVSVITPPAVSLDLLKKYASDPRIVALWLQPGAADGPVVQWVQSQPDNIQERVIYSGNCILVSGEKFGKRVGRL